MTGPSPRHDAAAPAARLSWDAALVCINGHIVNDRMHSAPARNADHCPVCSADTVSHCPGCREPLTGALLSAAPDGSAAGVLQLTRIPRFCTACGRPFPWTERTLSAARAVIRELAALEPHVRRRLRQSLDHIIRETPQTWTAVQCINDTLAQLGVEEATTLRALIVGVAADTIRPRLVGAGAE